jgi:electron transfer flavoprotein-quinone oxidoreductase
MAEKVDVIVVGAGLAGLMCARELARAGMEVLVVERGDYPGAKNVTGGRLYLNPIRPFTGDLFDNAPFERPVVKERLTVMADQAAVTVELTSERLRRNPYHSVTVLRSPFDRWLADVVMEQGGLIIPRNIVRELVIQDGCVVGIQADEEIHTDVVVAADGVLSFIAEQAGLRKRLEPKHFAVGIKEVIELPARTIEDRFGVSEGQGAAQLYFGSITHGMMGGGFLYTNKDSLSLGMVVGIQALMDHQPPIESYRLFDEFKARPEVAALIAGGHTVEYSAHVIPEGGIEAVPQITGNGILAVGDAAGLGLNMGVTVRGMDLAIASGVMAARAILKARETKDFSRAGLAHYETLLKSSFVWRDLQTFQHMPHLLENPRLFTRYPQLVCDTFEKMLWIGEEPKDKLSATALGEVRKNLLNLAALRDGLSLLKV